MSRDEAYKAMKQGNKITHRYFSPDEYLHMPNGQIKSEEGYDFEEGWEMRKGGYWESGWELYQYAD